VLTKITDDLYINFDEIIYLNFFPSENLDPDNEALHIITKSNYSDWIQGKEKCDAVKAKLKEIEMIMSVPKDIRNNIIPGQPYTTGIVNLA
jgi:hypothetical protein